MSLITWSHRYSVGVPEIDDQHKKLFHLVNQLYDAMLEGKGTDVLGPVLTELVDYTAYHFEAEERLLAEYAYPEYEEHKQMHDYLTERTQQLKKDSDSGNASLSMDVMLFLSNWLNIHILEVDRKYAPFLRRKVISRHPERPA